MPAFAALTLKNNAATNVTFNPLTIDSATGVASYGTADANWDSKTLVTVSSSTPSGRSPRARQRMKVVVPVMDALDATKKIDENIIEVSVNFSKSSTALQRSDARAYIDSLLQSAIATAYAQAFEGVY